MNLDESKLGMKIPLLEEVEKRLSEVFQQRKEEIERELEEKIRREKEEAEKKLRLIEQELEKGRELLTDYHQVLADFETERNRLQAEIKERFGRVVKHQSEIEKLASLTLEEIKQVEALNRELETLEKRSGEKINFIRQQIEEKYGIVTTIPEIPAEAELKINLEQELERLKKIQELLSMEVARMSEVGGPAAEAAPSAEVSPELEPAKPLETMEAESGEAPAEPSETEPYSNFIGEPTVPEESPQVEPGAETGVETFREVYERLEGFRRSHSEGNGEIPYFEKDGRMIIDAENLITAMNEALEASNKLYQKLAQTDSPKDHFFIKQEIINQQELLRKQLLRITKLCDKEGFTLPRFTESILNVNLLRDLLERLSIENWSDETDFQSITEFIESLKENFYRLITPPVVYLKAILEELGAA